MRNILREQRRSSMVAAVVTILMGLLLIFVPDRSIQLLCALLGGALMLTGVIYIFGWLSKRRETGFPVWFLLPGVILVALGLWLCTSPASVVLLIQYIFAAILIFHGVIDIQGAVSLMRQGWNRWWMDLLLAGLTLVLGILILLNPFGAKVNLRDSIYYACDDYSENVSLVFDGVSDLSLIHRLSKAFREMDGDWYE